MGFSYLLIILNIGSSIVTKKKKKEAKIIMHLLLGLQLAKMSSPRKSQRTFFYRDAWNLGANQEKEASLLQAHWVVSSGL